MFKNWRTTLFGASSVITGIALIVKGDLTNGIAAILCGLGLAASKDANNGLKM
jgi:hypothetical protein